MSPLVPSQSSPPRLCWRCAAALQLASPLLIAPAQNRRAKRHTRSSHMSKRRRKKKTHHFRQGGAGPTNLPFALPVGCQRQLLANASSSRSRDDHKGHSKHKQSGACAECVRCVADGAGPLCRRGACVWPLPVQKSTRTLAWQRNAGHSLVAKPQRCSLGGHFG
jgi:hypothetical protein